MEMHLFFFFKMTIDLLSTLALDLAMTLCLICHPSANPTFGHRNFPAPFALANFGPTNQFSQPAKELKCYHTVIPYITFTEYICNFGKHYIMLSKIWNKNYVHKLAPPLKDIVPCDFSVDGIKLVILRVFVF